MWDFGSSVKNYSYKGFIPTLAKEFVASMGSIRAEHGFNLGPESETILCKLLRQVLPSQYGICRGYLPNSKGEVAGDYTGPLFPIKVIGNPQMLIGFSAIFEKTCVFRIQADAISQFMSLIYCSRWCR